MIALMLQIQNHFHLMLHLSTLEYYNSTVVILQYGRDFLHNMPPFQDLD